MPSCDAHSLLKSVSREAWVAPCFFWSIYFSEIWFEQSMTTFFFFLIWLVCTGKILRPGIRVVCILATHALSSYLPMYLGSAVVSQVPRRGRCHHYGRCGVCRHLGLVLAHFTGVGIGVSTNTSTVERVFPRIDMNVVFAHLVLLWERGLLTATHHSWTTTSWSSI